MKPRLESLLFIAACALHAAAAGSVHVSLDPAAGGRGKFAEAEILREAAEKGLGPAEQADAAGAIRVKLVLGAGGAPQSYRIRVGEENGGRVIEVLGADPSGLMYGGLDIAEAIRTGTLEALEDSDHRPHIAQRGIKLNMPLDLRTPSYSDPSDAFQANIPEMWSMEFWREMFDDMARHRYNVITLWSLHPFPSLVRVPEFPGVALDDVWRTNVKLDGKFNGNGLDFVRPGMLADHEVVKTMTIDEKIRFWREVMQLGRDRGIDVYWFFWNIFLYGAEGKEGITGDKLAPRTIEYFRASVRELIRTYPLLAGLGITAGEGFPEGMDSDDKEKWLWQTYGEGIRDGLKDTPGREFRLIHRFHQTALSGIRREFAQLPCRLDLSYKYAVAHMYSVTDPRMIGPVLPLLSPELRCWLTLRNDDIYSFRWADADYAREFIKNIPGGDKIAGFYMGSDGYHWGRDFLARDPGGPRPTVMRKQWMSFSLWGRLAYDPDLPDSVFQAQIRARFPGADIPRLTAAWADASGTFPRITRFFWGDIDVKWFPEACRKKGRFYHVRDFVEGGTMPSAGVLNIIEWRRGVAGGKMPPGTTPLEIADALGAGATRALDALPALQQARVAPAAGAREYAATLGDIESMAHLGLYYAAKIRGACEIALFDQNGDRGHKRKSMEFLEAALVHWKNYSASYTRQYVQPVLYNRAGLVDIPALTEEVEDDIRMVERWEKGQIDEAAIERSGTEAGFSN